LELEWDESKRRIVFAERGVDVLRAARIFENDVVTTIDDRHDYGEERLISFGLVEGECFYVVHTQRGDVTRLITAWKGSRNDVKRYKASIAERHSKDGR
jgi:uncharacterized DUF497 family protein